MIDWTKIEDGGDMPGYEEEVAWCYPVSGTVGQQVFMGSREILPGMVGIVGADPTHWARVGLPGEEVVCDHACGGGGDCDHATAHERGSVRGDPCEQDRCLLAQSVCQCVKVDQPQGGE